MLRPRLGNDPNRDLGVEQLGAVYETLLDYEPRVERGSVSLQPGSGVRKATGTFYTPQPIADHLVRRTLAPLVRGLSPDRIVQLRVVDPAMGSGAFLVATFAGYAQSVVDNARLIFGAQAASIMFYEEDSHELVFEAVSGAGEESLDVEMVHALQLLAE